MVSCRGCGQGPPGGQGMEGPVWRCCPLGSPALCSLHSPQPASLDLAPPHSPLPCPTRPPLPVLSLPGLAPWTAACDSAPRSQSFAYCHPWSLRPPTFIPDKDVGLQGPVIHPGDSDQHVPQGGVSDFRNLLLGEQPRWEGAGGDSGLHPPSSAEPDGKRSRGGVTGEVALEGL